MLVLKSSSAEETRQIGIFLGEKAGAGQVVALSGELGAGKTVLVQGIARGLQACDEVFSPSYVLMNIYRGRLMLYHFDFYRLKSVEELFELDLDEYFYGEGLTVVEWSDKFPAALPENRLEVNIQKDHNDLDYTRHLYFQPRGAAPASLVHEMNKLFKGS